MVKINVNIEEPELEILSKIAEKLGLSVETLIQQSVDQDLTQMSVWLQRFEMLDH